MYLKIIRVLLCFLPFCNNAQLSIYSPFSIVGIGTIQNENHQVFSSLGNTYSSYSDSNHLNIFQPASYSLLGKGQPLFSFGMRTSFYSFWENSLHYTKRNTAIQHFALGIPIKKRFGIGFGLKPFTSKGYNVSEKIPFTNDTLINQYTSSGNTSEAFIGVSANVLKLNKHKLSIGIQGAYIFGKTKDRRSAQLNSQKFALIEDNEIQLKALRYELGLQYSYNLLYDRQLHFGVIYSPTQNLTAFQNISRYNSVYVDDEKSFKTIDRFNYKSNITFPSILNIGISYIYRPKIDKSSNRKNIPQVQLFSKFSNQNWKEYKTSSQITTSDTLRNTFSLGFGIEYAPHFFSQDRNKSINYLSKMRYRISWEYAQIPNIVRANKFNKNTYSLGLFFPITNQKTLSSISVSFFYQNIESTNKAFWNEKNFGINFGVQIAPGFYDKWFKKYKID